MAIFNSYVICELIGKTIARSTMHFSWVVIHYFDWAMFNSYVNVYQRVMGIAIENHYL
jgi:hypothetical protein